MRREAPNESKLFRTLTLSLSPSHFVPVHLFRSFGRPLKSDTWTQFWTLLLDGSIIPLFTLFLFFPLFFTPGIVNTNESLHWCLAEHQLPFEWPGANLTFRWVFSQSGKFNGAGHIFFFLSLLEFEVLQVSLCSDSFENKLIIQPPK